MPTTELQVWDEGSSEVAWSTDAGQVALAVLEERARSYEANESANTWRAYQSDLRHFGAWCEG